eukprot:4961553-Alexandrium_andersonii.AAC.1
MASSLPEGDVFACVISGAMKTRQARAEQLRTSMKDDGKTQDWVNARVGAEVPLAQLFAWSACAMALVVRMGQGLSLIHI